MEYQCEVCGHQFRTKFHLQRHMFTHMEKEDFFCDICGQHFCRMDYYNRHLKKHVADQMKNGPTSGTTYENVPSAVKEEPAPDKS